MPFFLTEMLVKKVNIILIESQVQKSLFSSKFILPLDVLGYPLHQKNYGIIPLTLGAQGVSFGKIGGFLGGLGPLLFPWISLSNDVRMRPCYYANVFCLFNLFNV